MRIANGLTFDGEGFSPRDVFIEGGRFATEAFAREAGGEGGEDVLDASGCYVIPGLIDVHFHGAMGHDFCDADAAGVAAIARYEASRGVTSICPTTMTLPEERLAPIMASIAAHATVQRAAAASRAAEAEGASASEPSDDSARREAAILGINMEGPFISPGKVGAQNPGYVRGASVEEFSRLQGRAGGLIKIVDVAPEEPGNIDFIRAVAHDVRVSVAHTCADYETACAAFDAGAAHLTHLYNAMPGLHHRKPGPIAAAVEHPSVTPELIADGVHVRPAMVRLAFQLFGDDRVILISDSLRACGLGDGEYELGGQQFTVRGNRATIANGSLAGSVSDVMRCLRTAVLEMGIPLASAVKAASANPARALGLAGERGTLSAGAIADAVLLDKRTLEVRRVILRGRAL